MTPGREGNQHSFIPIMGGPFYKQLYLYDYLKMNAIAFNLVNHNAIAAAAVKMLQRFTLGRGVTFNIKDDECRTLCEAFWIGPRRSA